MKKPPKIKLLAMITLFASSLAAIHAHADTLYVSYLGAQDQIEEISMTNGVGTDLGAFASTGLDEPYGLAFDSTGNLYVANANNNTIEKFTPGGAGSTFSNTGLSVPVGVAFDAEGNLYVANPGTAQSVDGYIQKITPSGAGSFFASTTEDPGQLAFDSAGNLYVVNQNSDTIGRITPGGLYSDYLNASSPEGLAIDSSNNFYVANYFNNSIEKYSSSGQDLGVFASVTGPQALTLDSAGNLFVASAPNDSISEFSSNGTFLGSFTTSDSPSGIIVGPTPVPEPSTWAMLAMGGTGLLFAFRRRRH